MGIVTLVSGGYDSTLMSLMARDEGLGIHPLFVNYGQLAVDREWAACQLQHTRLNLPSPHRIDVSGFGRSIVSGITDKELRINEDAFLPCRNLFLLVLGAAYAYQVQAQAVAIGLLDPEFRLFPDQTLEFIDQTDRVIHSALGRAIRILTPLAHFSKAAVLEAARERGICGTYSCHAGGSAPCGHCVACAEILNAQKRS